MIDDREERFPNSCVDRTWFESYELRQMFAYLRELEDVLQRQVKAANEQEKPLLLDKLRFVEKWLYWMVNNVTGSPEEKYRRRHGYVPEWKQFKEPKVWTKERFLKVMRGEGQ